MVAASGDHDEHVYAGWYYGRVYDLAGWSRRFPLSSGSRPCPQPGPRFWQTVRTAWPVEPEEASWSYADYQPVQWAQHGPGEPGAYPSLADYVAASQAYQSLCVQYAVDQMRAHKFMPTGGILQFMFTDCWPAISWSVLDYYRLPKLAYRSLARAFNPTHVCIGFVGEPAGQDSLLVTFREGANLGIRLHVVNDDYRVSGQAALVWRVEAVAGRLPLLSRLRLLARGLPRGRVQLSLPAAGEPAALALQWTGSCRVVLTRSAPSSGRRVD